MMNGRVKTLHPRIHGGLPGGRGIDDGVMQGGRNSVPIDTLLVATSILSRKMAKKGLPLEDLSPSISI
jgi:AICAR transformylase/IMP cyclohydrolase PurH